MIKALKAYKTLTILIAILLIYSVYFFTTMTRRSINRTVNILEKAIEKEDISTSLTYLSDNYLDDYGYRKNDVRETLKELFLKIDELNVTIVKTNILEKDEDIVVDIWFKVVGTLNQGMRGYLLGNMNVPAMLSARFQKEDTRWTITHISTIKHKPTE